MADFPALPLFTDSFIADTIHLDAVETGAYIMLLMSAWRTQTNSLPDDDKRLARFARCSMKQWQRIKPSVMVFWTLRGDGWHQKKLDKVRQKVEAQRELKSAAGKASALKRHETDLTHVVTERQQPKPKPKPVEKDSTIVESKNPKRGCRLSDEFGSNGSTPPIPEDYEEAARGIGVRAAEQWPIFYDYWLAQPGQKGVKSDWLATWRNWCRKSVEYGGSRAPPKFRSRMTDAITETLEFYNAKETENR